MSRERQNGKALVGDVVWGVWVSRSTRRREVSRFYSARGRSSRPNKNVSATTSHSENQTSPR